MKKIYLSPALHGSDNATRCPITCSENTHCGQYMDIVEKRLKALGFQVKRGGPETGTDAMYDRVAESNKWGANVHYVAHTNAGGGRYSMTMCWNNAKSKKWTNILHKHRQTIPTTHKVVTNNELYEIRATSAVCLYDELFFHDNAADCQWFHNGGMEKMAEETVKALCEICGVKYRATNAPTDESSKPATVVKPTTNAASPRAFSLNKEPLYAASTSKTPSGTATGRYYRWDNKTLRGRVRITTSPDYVGVAGKVTGWVDAKAVK